MFSLSFWEIGMILLVALLVLGPKRLPELAKTLGKGLRELRKASSDIRSVIEEPLEEIRRPLADMRKDIVETVYRIEDEIEQEAARGDVPAPGAGLIPPEAIQEARERAPSGEDGSPVVALEVEDRRRMAGVEAIYAATLEPTVSGAPGQEAAADAGQAVMTGERPAEGTPGSDAPGSAAEAQGPAVDKS